jgi:glycosyltransferase involved in cell wall biosynthesis
VKTHSRSSRPCRVLYIQYANPAFYPPLENGSQLLAEAGCEVRLLGTEVHGPRGQQRAKPGVDARLINTRLPGRLRHLHYFRYLAWVLWHALVWRPGWIYASDFAVAPIAILATRLSGAWLLYHEHDAPSPARSTFGRVCHAARRVISRTAALVLAPNAARLAALPNDLGTRGRVVPNCPRRNEVREGGKTTSPTVLRLVYGGSIVPARLPLTLIDAVATLEVPVELVVIGYETVGARGYVAHLAERAAERGARGRIRFLGSLLRGEMLDLYASCDLGVALFPPGDGELNHRTMVGASNKPYELLACGTALLVSDDAHWRESFVDAGLALPCDPGDSRSLERTLRWAAEHRQELAAMGERGRKRALLEWNYDIAFAPVRDEIVGGSVSASRRRADALLRQEAESLR